MRPINIVHLYPKEMNIYGDNGNLLVLSRRLAWRRIAYKIHLIGVDDKLPSDTNLIIGGGGQDKGQQAISVDLKKKSKTLKAMANDGVPMLMVCGTYQMFGHYFVTQGGEHLPGIGLLDIHTVADKKRLIGNVVSQTVWGKMVGYENHSGLSYLANQVRPFGLTKKGQGNNGVDKTEGAIKNNVFGTYLHGPVLAKSPRFADYLLELAGQSARQTIKLDALDDSLEKLAKQAAMRRPR